MTTQLGIDHLLSDNTTDHLSQPIDKKELRSQRLALVAHPASVTHSLTHSLNALVQSGLSVNVAYGPQHGMRGEKQDNMIESEDYRDPELGIPVLSLYGSSRKPSAPSFELFDLCLFDLQDVGTRIYTFLTTLRYMMEACATHHKPLWVLDRPNPAGRSIEGTRLRPGWESFVGAASFPMRHGLTLGECALWLKQTLQLDLDLKIIPLRVYHPETPPTYGWPANHSWVNPSPNAASPSMAKIFPGTVLLEGTTLSEGRGTTRPLELLGAPGLPIRSILRTMEQMAPQWMKGALFRPCYFEPMFQKHQGALCDGFQIHVDHPLYNPLEFKPYRLMALFFKALRQERPDYPLWRNFHYEYETDRLAIDLINGSPLLREWVDDPAATVGDFELINQADEQEWQEQVQELYLYR